MQRAGGSTRAEPSNAGTPLASDMHNGVVAMLGQKKDACIQPPLQ